MKRPTFTFIDLFSGIGGFHAALSALGGECVYASEIDEFARTVYKHNWGMEPRGDITLDANDEQMLVPKHDVLTAGFPCQPFSKSGAQRGMDETRGTLYWNILKIVEARGPSLVILENVRNLCGPRHRHEWEVIIETLRSSGYRVSEYPWIISPHQIPLSQGGRPQVRERVFIIAVRTRAKNRSVPLEAVPKLSKISWNLERDLPLEKNVRNPSLKMSAAHDLWVAAWDDMVRQMSKRTSGAPLPGFPLWGDSWNIHELSELPEDTPKWKRDFLQKNVEFYAANRDLIDQWADKWNFYSDDFPPSRRKFEWQAGIRSSLRSTLIQFRPSGIRVKPSNYTPALVAISQTPLIVSKQRFLSVREAARLQGLPDWFSFGTQPDPVSYKQLGNGVSIGAVWMALKHASDVLGTEIAKQNPKLQRAISNAPKSPDEILRNRP